MAYDLQTSFPGSGGTLYVIIRDAAAGTVWSTVAETMGAWADGSVADYDVALADLGGDQYGAAMPANLPAGAYRFVYYEQAGGTPATTDLILKTVVATWTGSGLTSGSETVTLDSFALTTLESVKRRLEMADDTSADDVLTEIINGVSAEIERVTGVKFKARDYRQWLNGANQREICLPHYPVQHLTRVAWGAAQALSVTYGGSGIRASASIYKDPESADAGGLRLVTVSSSGVKTENNLSFATYGSVSALATAVAAVSGWTATTINNVPSLDLVPGGATDAKGRAVFFNYPDVDDYSYSLDHETGRLRFDNYGAGAWPWAGYGQGPGVSGWRVPLNMPRGFQHVLVEYRGGYETIPADVQLVANELVQDNYHTAQIGAGVTEMKLGVGTLKFSDSQEDMVRDRLSAYIDLSRMIGGV